jgi:hypothetical protein
MKITFLPVLLTLSFAVQGDVAVVGLLTFQLRIEHVPHMSLSEVHRVGSSNRN